MATDSGDDLVRPGPNSGTGLEPNVAAALSYVLGIITGVIFVMLERNALVRFHAFQSIFLTIAWIVFWIAFSIVQAILIHIPFINILAFIFGLLLSMGLGLGGLILWIILIIKAYQGQRFSLPIVGPIAERYAAR